MKAFLIALQFLTRIHLAAQTVWSDDDFGRSVRFFPVVGIIIGLFLWLVYALGQYVFSGLVLPALVVAAGFYITGGLHADGFMDTADGLFSGRDRQRMLEILKDSHVGSMAVIAFSFLVLLKVAFLNDLPAERMAAVLISVPAASRFGTLISIFEFPYVRPQGLGRAFVEKAPAGTLPMGFAGALLPALYFGWLPVILVGAAMVISLSANTYITHKLGGVTGDTYGAVTELSELLLYAIIYLLP